MLEQPGRNKAYFNTGGMVKIRFIPPRTNSELYVFFRLGQSMVNFFVSGGQSTPITLFYALDGHRILPASIIVFVLCRKIPIQSAEWPYQSNEINGLFNLNAEKIFFPMCTIRTAEERIFSLEIRILYTLTRAVILWRDR